PKASALDGKNQLIRWKNSYRFQREQFDAARHILTRKISASADGVLVPLGASPLPAPVRYGDFKDRAPISAFDHRDFTSVCTHKLLGNVDAMACAATFCGSMDCCDEVLARAFGQPRAGIRDGVADRTAGILRSD